VYFLFPMDSSSEGPDAELLAARLVCSWCTTQADVDQFLELVQP